MFSQILPSIRATIVIGALTGIAFPVCLTFLSQMLFPDQANGSLIRDKQGQVIGSRLIGQPFTKAEYFHPRPSAAGSGYAGEASGGTNLGPTSSKLILGLPDDPASKDTDESYAGVKQLSQTYREENLLSASEKAPVDAVTRSGSGLDPHISEANAMFQARRVAKARGVEQSAVESLIKSHCEPRQLGFLGEPKINVLMLNLALDELEPGSAGVPPAPTPSPRSNP